MRGIGGNTLAMLQIKSTEKVNRIGEWVEEWENRLPLTGWLDLSTGDSKHTNFNAKVQESSHIFLCDYADLEDATSENARLLIQGQVYEILLIDNPMNMNEQLEIYLRFVGGGGSVS